MTTLTRREFGSIFSRLMLALGTMGSWLWTSGCDIFTDIKNWVPIGEAALNAILAVLTGNGVLISPAIQTIVNLVEAGFTALRAAIKEYQSTTPPPVGALAKVETAFKDIVDSFRTFLASLNVSGGLLGIVIGLGQIIFSTIAAFLNRLPATSSLRRTVSISSSERIAGTAMVVIVPKDRTRRAFKKDWNRVLDAGPAVGVVVPQSAYLKLSLFEHL